MKRGRLELEPVQEARECEQYSPHDEQLAWPATVDHGALSDSNALVFISAPVSAGRFFAALSLKWV
jgi:hypothetical protein